MTVGSSSGGRKSHKDVPTVEALQVCGRFSCFSNGNGASLYKGVFIYTAVMVVPWNGYWWC